MHGSVCRRTLYQHPVPSASLRPDERLLPSAFFPSLVALVRVRVARALVRPDFLGSAFVGLSDVLSVVRRV